MIEPSYIEPYQMPESMMIAVAVSRKYVIGSGSAMVAADPSPGRMPTIAPSATPMKQNSRQIGCSEIEHPGAILAKVSKSGLQRHRVPRADLSKHHAKVTHEKCFMLRGGGCG